MSQEYEDLAFLNISAAMGPCGRLRIIEASAYAFSKFTADEGGTKKGTASFDRWDELFPLGVPVPQEVETLTGVSTLLLAGAESREVVVNSLLDFIGTRTIVLLDAPKNLPLLQLESSLVGHPLGGQYIDVTSKLFPLYLPQLPSHSLDDVCGYFGIAADVTERTATRENIRSFQACMYALTDTGVSANSTVKLFDDVHPHEGTEIAFVDVETTGLDASNGYVTEISVQVWKAGKGVVDSFTSFVRIPVMVPLETTKLTGISDEMLKDAPPISEVLPRALEVIGRRTIAAYNAPFDMGFLETECRRLGLALSNPGFCVMQQAQSVLGYLPGGFKLANVADVLGVQQVRLSHRAEADATLALNVALAIWDGQLPYGREKLDIKLVCEIHTSGRLVPPPVVVWEAECAPILREVVDQVDCSVWTRDRSDYINVYGPEGGYGEGVIARIYKDENPELAAFIRTGEEVECIAKKVGNDAFEVHLSRRSR